MYRVTVEVFESSNVVKHDSLTLSRSSSLGSCDSFSNEEWSGTVRLFRLHESRRGSEMPSVGGSSILAFIAVPESIEFTELLRFASMSDSKDRISAVHRVINPMRNQHSIIINFTHSTWADQCIANSYGRRFDKKRHQICYVVPVSCVEFKFNVLDKHSLFQLYSDVFEPSKPEYFELPSCPMCVERIDTSISGILTLTCSHRNRCQCISSWETIICSVCRALLAHNQTDKCFACDSAGDLWICLVCGHIGCNRFSNSHAVTHFERLKHRFSLDLKNQYVWDYVGDGYVHRLLFRHDGDTPLIFADSSKPDEEEEADLAVAKLESLSIYYNEVLLSQLQKQAEHFEGQIERFREETVIARKAQQTLVTSLREEKLDYEVLLEKLQKQLKASLKRHSAVQDSIQKSQEESNFLKLHNETILKDRQRYTEEQLSEIKETISSKYQKVLASLDKEIEVCQKKVDQTLALL